MSYPNQPQPPYPPQAPPQQGYPPAPQAPYPPAAPQAPFPPQQPYPAQPYPQQAPPAQYPQQQAYGQAPPPPPPPRTTLKDYMNQAAAGADSLKFPVPGHNHTMTVARELDDPDFPPDLDPQGNAKLNRDHSVRVVMVVPVLVRPDEEHPDGKASLWVKGQMAEALKQAMSAVGAGDRNGVPEAGAEIFVQFNSTVAPKRAGNNPKKIYSVVYRRPAGAVNGQQAAVPVQAPYVPPAVSPQQDTQPQYAGVQAAAQQPQYQVPAPQYADPAQAYQQATGQQAPVQPAPAGMAGPAEQVAAAHQAGVQAAQQYAQSAPPPPAPQAQPPLAAPPGMDARTAAVMRQALGQMQTGDAELIAQA